MGSIYFQQMGGGVSPSPTHLGGVTDVLRTHRGPSLLEAARGQRRPPPATVWPAGLASQGGTSRPRAAQSPVGPSSPCLLLLSLCLGKGQEQPTLVARSRLPSESPRGHRVSVAAGPCWAGEVPVTQASLPWARRPLDGLLRWLQCRGAARRSPERLTFPQMAMELLCLVGLGWGCWLGRAWEAVCVSNLTMRHSLC